MPDYQKMYLTLAKAVEDTVSILIQAQQASEGIYISAPKADIKVLDTTRENEKKHE